MGLMEKNLFFFDTNAVLYFLSDESLKDKNINFEIVISFITEIELLCYPYLTEEEKGLLKSFLKNLTIVDINSFIKEKTMYFRKKYKIKIPDAIIISSAYMLNIPLITDDKQLFKVKEIEILSYKEFKSKLK